MNGMLREVAELVGKPLLRRLGTATAALLIANGAHQDAANQLMLALGAVIALVWDIALAWSHDQRTKRKTVEHLRQQGAL